MKDLQNRIEAAQRQFLSQSAPYFMAATEIYIRSNPQYMMVSDGSIKTVGYTMNDADAAALENIDIWVNAIYTQVLKHYRLTPDQLTRQPILLSPIK